MESHDTTHRMTGGELDGPLRETCAELRRLIQQEPDVHRLLALEPEDATDPETRWLYLIETPFASYPRFVIGCTDARNEDPRILFQSATEWSAEKEWSEHLTATR